MTRVLIDADGCPVVEEVVPALPPLYAGMPDFM